MSALYRRSYQTETWPVCVDVCQLIQVGYRYTFNRFVLNSWSLICAFLSPSFDSCDFSSYPVKVMYHIVESMFDSAPWTPDGTPADRAAGVDWVDVLEQHVNTLKLLCLMLCESIIHSLGDLRPQRALTNHFQNPQKPIMSEGWPLQQKPIQTHGMG